LKLVYVYLKYMSSNPSYNILGIIIIKLLLIIKLIIINNKNRTIIIIILIAKINNLKNNIV